ncbi:MAG: molybdopterin-guanine dinucleotide biosynthesis protein B [Bacillota bacterium]
MRVFSVVGITKSGKTTTIENLIRELKRRRYSVGSVKDIHFEEFAIDTEGTNTHRHWQAGAELVTARGLYETDVLHKTKLPVKEILSFYDHDFVILEGVEDYCVPVIITAHTVEEIDGRLDDRVFAISGRISADMSEYWGLPVMDARSDCEALVDLIEEKVFPVLPNLPEECCGACGTSCAEMTGAILRGERGRSDCVVEGDEVELYVGGRKIDMVPFVQALLRNAVEGVARELDGYRENARLEVRINDRASR